MPNSTLVAQLRALLGNQVTYNGRLCRIIEVLEAEQALVLRCEGSEREIQPNQFGEATRRVQPSLTLPWFDRHSGELDPLIKDWLEQ